MMNKDVSVVFGANGSIGSIVAEKESLSSHVIGTYRRDDKISDKMKKHSNITMIQKNFLEDYDVTDVIKLARTKGRITKVYWMAGSSWNMGWDNASLLDFQKAIQVNALPIASAITSLIPELSDETNLMRWVAVTGTSSLIIPEGVNKPTTGGSKKLNEFYIKSAAAFWSCKNNLFNTVINGMSERKKFATCGNTPEERAHDVATQVPLRREAQPNEIAEICLWLNSDKNTFTTGGEIVCDGGEHIHTKNNYNDTPNRKHPKYYTKNKEEKK